VTAISVADPSQSANSTISLVPVSVDVTPPSVTVRAGQTQQFTAVVTGASNSAVTWSVSPAGSGTVTTAGLYTAPATATAEQTATVIATSVADPGKSDTATVTVSPAVSVSVSPPSVTLGATQSQQF